MRWFCRAKGQCSGALVMRNSGLLSDLKVAWVAEEEKLKGSVPASERGAPCLGSHESFFWTGR
jgi:hypothetical protein